MHGRLVCGCKRAQSGCVSGDGDRGGEGDGEHDLRFVWCWSSVPGSCVSGDVIGNRGIRGDVVCVYRASDDRSSVSGSCVSGDVIREHGGGGSVGGKDIPPGG